MEDRSEPPRALRLLADLVRERLDALGVRHETRFTPPTDSNAWRLSVATDDDEEDYIFGLHDRDSVGVIPAYQEDVSVPLAVEYVLMSLGFTSEEAWWEAFRGEQAVERSARRDARRARWRARLGRRK